MPCKVGQQRAASREPPSVRPSKHAVTSATQAARQCEPAHSTHTPRWCAHDMARHTPAGTCPDASPRPRGGAWPRDPAAGGAAAGEAPQSGASAPRRPAWAAARAPLRCTWTPWWRRGAPARRRRTRAGRRGLVPTPGMPKFARLHAQASRGAPRRCAPRTAASPRRRLCMRQRLAPPRLAPPPRLPFGRASPFPVEGPWIFLCAHRFPKNCVLFVVHSSSVRGAKLSPASSKGHAARVADPTDPPRRWSRRRTSRRA